MLLGSNFLLEASLLARIERAGDQRQTAGRGPPKLAMCPARRGIFWLGVN